jgi:DNA-binding NtrC family response regulator
VLYKVGITLEGINELHQNMTKAKNFKIFLVDDDLFSLSIYEQNLRSLGYKHISTFQSGTDCLDQLTQKPDVIFLDYYLDVLSGFDVLKKIKHFDRNIYVVMVSVQGDMQMALDSLRYGAFDYLIKGENEMERMKTALEKIAQIKDILQKKSPLISQGS